MKHILLFISLLLVGMTFANKTAKKKVAILEPVAKEKSVSVFQKETIKAALRKSITAIPGYIGLDRCNTNLVNDELKFQQSGQVSDAQRKELGELYGAELICVAEVTNSETSTLISVTLIYVESGQLFASEDLFVAGKSDEAIYNGCGKLAAELLGGSYTSNMIQESGNNSFLSSSSSRTQVRENLTINVSGVSFEMIYVQGGTFTMGCTSEQSGCENDESPTHNVSLSDYYIGKFEVTQELWEVVMGTNVRKQRDKKNPTSALYGEGYNYPMYYVSWEECMAFVRELNRMTGKQFALPTEAQWEYAARGGNKTTHALYAGGSAIDRVAWYSGNSSEATHPVGTKAPNELGIYDMSGNVWEWCSDWYGNYSSSPQTDPTGPYSGSSRVFRGGSWYSSASNCRVANRLNSSPGYRDYSLGLRLSLVQ